MRTHELLDAYFICNMKIRCIERDKKKERLFRAKVFCWKKKHFQLNVGHVKHDTFTVFNLIAVWCVLRRIPCHCLWFRYARELLSNINISNINMSNKHFLLNVYFKTWRCNRVALNILLYGLIIFHCIIDVLWFCRQTQRLGMVPPTLG